MNNLLHEFLEKKREEEQGRKPKYGMRKLSIGFVSCFLGCMIFMAPAPIHAQVEENKEPVAIEEPASQGPETPKAEAIVEEKAQDTLAPVEAQEVQDAPKAEAVEEKGEATPAPVEGEETQEEPKVEAVVEPVTLDPEKVAESAEELASEEGIAPEENIVALELAKLADSEAVAGEARTEAKDISNEITNQYVALTEEGHQTPGTVKPDDGEAIGWEVSFTTPRGTIAGDYFTIDLSENLSLKGIEPDHENEYPIEINDKVVADGVRLDRSTIKYTFNENVNDQRNIRVSVKGFAYVDKTKVPNTKDENFSISVGDTKDEKTLKVEYGDTYYTEDKLNGISQFTEFNPKTGEYTQVFYINPESETITTSTKDWAFGKVVMFIDGVTPDGSPSDVNYTEKDTTVSVQKLPAGTDVPSAIIENPVQTDEETVVKTTFRNGGIEIVFADNLDENLRSNNIDSPYIVTVKSVAAPSETGNNVYSKATLYGDGNKFHIMDNSIVTTEGDTDAQGDKVGYFKEHHVYYTKVDGVLQEDQTFTIHSSKTEGFDYDFYFTDKNEIEDFKFVKVDTDKLVENPAYNADGSLARGGYEVGKTKEVTYIYERDIKHGSFQEHHIYQTVDENKNVISTDFEESGKETTGFDETEYTTSKVDKDGYTLVEVKATNDKSKDLGVQFDGQGAETSGNYVNGEKLEVTYIYQKQEEKAGSFQDHHIYITKDQDGVETGRKTEDGKLQEGKKEESYTTSKVEKDGFTLVRTETPVEEPTYNEDGTEATGNFKPGIKQEITYVYEKIVTDPQKEPGSFIEHHIYITKDQDGVETGRKTEDGKLQEGKKEESYTTSKVEKDGFTLVRTETPVEEPTYNEDGTEATGNFKPGIKQEITYVYEKTVTDPQKEPGSFIEHHIYITKDQDGVETERKTDDGKLQEGKKEESYTTGKVEKDGFKFVRTETPVNEPTFDENGAETKGNYKPGVKQEITYVYEKTVNNPTTPITGNTDPKPVNPSTPKNPDPKPVNPSPNRPSEPGPVVSVVSEDSKSPETPVKEEEKTPEVKEEEKPVESPVEDQATEDKKEEVQEPVQEKARSSYASPVSTKKTEEGKAPQTFDPGVASYLGLGGLSSSLLAYFENKKRKNK